MNRSVRFVLLLLFLCLVTFVYVTANGDQGGSVPTPSPKPDNVVEFSGDKLGSARQMSAEDEIVAVMSFSEDVLKLSVANPCWSTDPAIYTYSLYSFDTNYEKSMTKTAIVTKIIEYTGETYSGFEWTVDAPLAKGIYVLVINGVEAGMAGIRYDGEYEGQYVYENGIYVKSNSVKMLVEYKNKPTKDYGELEKPKVDNTDKSNRPGPVFRFSDTYAEDYFDPNGNYLTTSLEDGLLVLELESSNDPYLYINIPPEFEIDAEQYPIMMIKILVPSIAPRTGQIFFNTTTFGGPNPNGAPSYKYSDSEDWQLAIVDLGSNTNYSGYLKSFRFDVFAGNTNALTTKIEWITFFESMDAAKAFDGNFDVFATPVPTASPIPSATPVKTNDVEPSATKIISAPTQVKSTQTPDSDKDDNSNTILYVIIAIVAVIAIAAVVIFVIKKKQ